jgi:hypothetical protein
MDLEIREALALAEDRATALAQLLPGSEDHDYYRCLHAQHAGALDDADAILHAWPERHGKTERYERLRLRQLLYRVSADPERAADETRDWFGVGHWHEAEVEEVDPTRATRLAHAAFSGAALLEEALRYDTNLTQVSDEGLLELIARPLEGARRRVLLSRVGHTPQPEIVELVADELGTRGAAQFGTLAAHQQLTLDQLHAVAQRRPELRGHFGWVCSVVLRMRPHHTVDLDADREARATYLDALWRFVAELPPAINTLKAHVLWHLLDTTRRRGREPDPTLIAAYLALPRQASYLPRRMLDNVRSDDVAQLGSDLRSVTGLPPNGSDEELVRELIQRRPDNGESYARWLDREWLDAELATAALLYGGRDPDRATLALGPARAAALRERVELAWCVDNPTRFGADDAVALDAEVKNVGDLVVKVFRIDPLAYFQHHHREVGTDLDLDGLAASHEQVIAIAEPPVRRVRRRIDLPMCARPGTYVVDLIGNGMSSRAVVQKGRLRHVARTGAAGHVVTIVDEAGAPRPDARAWIGEREYAPDERGAFVVPFSTAPARTPMLLFAGDIATVQFLELARETCALSMVAVLDREALAGGRSAKAIVRLSLAVAGAPASLALLERPTWDVTLRDRSGVATTRSQPLALDDDGAAVLEWPLADDTASVHLVVRGVVQVRSEQREQAVTCEHLVELATMHAGTAIEALYLARTASGYVISALGKSGEPRAQRPVTIALTHRWSRTQLNVELATDAQGRIELGELPGVEWIAATLGSLTQRWYAGDAWLAFTQQITAGETLVLPVPAGRTVDEVIRRLSLVETRGGAPARHPSVEIEALEGGIAIRGLAAGDYDLRAPGLSVAIAVAVAGVAIGGGTVTTAEVLDCPRGVPAIAALDAAGDLRIALREATPRTRVHVVATRFAGALVDELPLGPRRAPSRRLDRARAALFVSGRELGDEYRYILERRSAKRYPGLLLDKPSLLLNPWARRTTTTDIATARAGGAFAPAAAGPMGAAGYGGLAGEPEGAGGGETFAGYDFLPEPPVVLANLVPDAAGVVTVARDRLASATQVLVIVDDPAGMVTRKLPLPEPALAPRDLRLRLALDPARHVTQKKRITPLRPGDRLDIEDIATAKVHLVDSVERAHAYLLALRDDATLRELAFVTRWHQLLDEERREKYSKYACHELSLFLYFKDRAFFDAVVKPHLVHKRTKTFVDHWLLGADLAPYTEAAQLAKLNAFERALLAQRLDAEDPLPRILGDEVSILPPDPATDTRLIDALIGASTLDADDAIDEARSVAFEEADREVTGIMAEAALGAPPPGSAMRRTMIAAARPAPAPRQRAADKMKKEADYSSADMKLDAGDDLMQDLRRRDEAKPHYRAVDKTQEWAENNWWHRTPAESGPDMIRPSRLWRDLALHRSGAFLSPWLGLATGSFAEAMCALAVTDLPFVAGAHEIVPSGPRLAITAAGNALAGSSQLLDGELVTSGPPLVVGTSYVRTDDRYDYSTGEQVDKYIAGPFAAGVVYTCQVVLANPTSTRQRVAALVQVPRGSVPVAGARPTYTIDVALEPYGTHGHEYAFYFPTPGTWSHYPVHVSRGEAIVAAAPARPLEVTSGGAAPDPRSWSHVSQRGTLAEVVAYLATANVAATELARVAWRLRDRRAYDAIVGALEQRRAFDATLWGYALLHRDAPRIRAWLRSLGGRLLQAGPVLEMIDLDAEALGVYEHLELAPLINARAHRLGPKLRILNDGLAAQYDRFLNLVAHRPAPTAEDLLAGAAYLVTQDRFDAALATLARVRVDAIADRMQHDYLAAFAACVRGDVTLARERATRWRDHPVDRWRNRFRALLGMLDELTGSAPAVVDPRSREQQHADLAARQPAFELALDREGVIVRSQHVAALELRFFEMDIELLFSRQPFVQSDVSRFSYIEPGHRERLGELAPEVRLAWPAALRGKNVVVEAVGVGQRKAKVHYANDLALQLANQVGQVRVERASDRVALAATYVKVYARKKGGAVTFYKDGYTDLRGWFDYASLSTTELDHVERFAILVCSDQAGAAILEAAPPVR